MSLNHGSFIVDKDQLDHVFRFAIEKRIKFIYVFSNAPNEVYEIFSVIDREVNEHKFDYSPKLRLWEKPNLGLKVLLSTSFEFLFIIYKPTLKKDFLATFYELILKAKEKKCCLFLMFNDLPFSWENRFRHLTKVYFKN